jgi:hypothetical protein
MANEHVAEPFKSILNKLGDPLTESITHAQKIAMRIGANQMAVEVYGWAIRNARTLSSAQLKELLNIVAKEPE